MNPPTILDSFDSHGGFTIQTRKGDSLWRPGQVLKGASMRARLVSSAPGNWQGNQNVTLATYKQPAYGYPILAWFDNATGERIA